MKASRETVLAIIPAYSEGKFIGDVVRRVLQHVKTVLVVDDGSPDNTAGATQAAFFLFLDGDGQHDPSDIPAFFDAINESGADLIVGNRMMNIEAMPVVRRLTNKFMSWQIGAIC